MYRGGRPGRCGANNGVAPALPGGGLGREVGGGGNAGDTGAGSEGKAWDRVTGARWERAGRGESEALFK